MSRVLVDVRSLMCYNITNIVISGDETGGTYSLAAFTMAPPATPGLPPHIPEDADEAIYALDGTPEMGIGERRLIGESGAVMLVPKGTLHPLVNVESGPAHVLVILSPPGDAGFWRAMVELRATRGGPLDPEAVLALQRTYHVAAGGQARRFD